jgi:hypothetical protein
MDRSGKFALGGSLVALMLGVGGCTIEKEESGQLPDVDVQGGNMRSTTLNTLTWMWVSKNDLCHFRT